MINFEKSNVDVRKFAPEDVKAVVSYDLQEFP